MRVLIAGVSRFCAPTGICRYTDLIARALSDLPKVKTTIVVGAWQEGYFRDVFKSGSHSRLIGLEIGNSSWSRNLWYSMGLPSLAHQLRAGVVHLTYPAPLLRPLPCPTVFTVHDMYPFEVPDNFSFPLANKMFFRMCLSQCRGVICVSKTTLTSLTKFFPRAASTHTMAQIYDPVIVPDLLPEQGSVRGLQASRFVLSVAQHRKNKNLDVLLRAFAGLLMSQQIPQDWRLVIVGSDGPESSELRALTSKLRLEDHVVYFSSISDSELAWLYRNSSIAAFPSSHEGFCMPLVEAISSGAKVVCSDIPTLREVAGDACVYFSLESDPVRDLANALAAALSRPIRKLELDGLCRPTSVGWQLLELYNTVTERLRAAEPGSAAVPTAPS